MDVRQRLQSLDLDHRLIQLGVHDEDREAIAGIVAAVMSDERDLDAVQLLANEVLLPNIGNWFDYNDTPGFPEETADHPAGRGALPIVALIATADDVHAAHLRRGIPEDLSWQSLADFGHQVAKHRWVEGTHGLHNQGWLRNAWADGFLWLDRLEFELSRTTFPGEDAPTVVLGTHIPDGGPLDPERVANSFRLAAELFPRYYPEVGPIEWFTCQSWLLDPNLQQIVPGSNMATFQALWEPYGSNPGDRDGYYFGFNIEPEKGRELPYGLDELPYDSRLHRGMVDFWRGGGHFVAAHGRIPVSQYEASA